MNSNVKANNSKIVIGLITFYLSLFCVGYVSPFLCVLCAYLVGLYFAYKRNWATLLYLISFMVIQNIMMIILANRFGDYTSLFMMSKEVMVYASILFSLVEKRSVGVKEAKHFFIVLLYVTILLLSFCLSSASFYARLTSVRQLLLPFALFYFGKTLKIDGQKLIAIERIIVCFSLLIGLIGCIEVFVIKDAIWASLPIYQYQVNKGTTFNLYNNVPLNFYTWDLYDILHVVVRRLVSIFADPLVTAHFLLFGFVLVDICISKKINKILLQIFFAMCILLTLSKGAILCLIIYICMRIFKNASYKSIIRFLWVFIIFLILALCILGALTYLMPTSSIVIHYSGLINGLTNSKLIGCELGNAGVMTNILTESESEFGESYIGVLCVQLGYIGVAMFLLFWGVAILYLIRLNKFSNIDNTFNIACLLFALIIESLFSETSIAFLSSGLYFIFAGIFSTRRVKLDNKARLKCNRGKLSNREQLYAVK